MTSVVAIDQALKALIIRALPLGSSIALLPAVLSLTHVHNPGVAFSLLPQVPAFVPAVIVLTLLFLLFTMRPSGRGLRRCSAPWHCSPAERLGT